MRGSRAFVVGTLLVAGAVGMTMVAGASNGGANVDGPVGDHADPSPALAVAPQPDGSATVHVTYAFDLSDGDRQAAFEEFQTNETARSAFANRFADRMRSVAADAAAATGRDMAVRDVSVDLRTVENTGIVEVSLIWEGLAAVDGNRLAVTEPFASGFAADRPVHVLVPDGYEVVSVGPAPDTRTDGRLEWTGGTDFEGFEVVLASDGSGGDGDSDNTSGADGPGFGIALAVFALLSAGALARR